MIEQLKTIRAGLETATCYSMLGVDAHAVQTAITALTQLEAMVGEPVAWCPALTYPGHEKDRAWANGKPRKEDIEYWTLNGKGITYAYAAPVAQQYEAGDMASAAAQGFRDGVASVAQQPPKLEDIEQYRMQMAGISTAAMGYWKEGDSIHPDYDTPALRDVAKLYAQYDALYKAQQPQAEAVPTVQVVNCDTCKHSANSCDDYPCNRCGVEFGDGPFNRWEAPQQAEAMPSSDLNPDEGDPVTLWAEIWRLREAVKGPDGYATWQDAATAERIRRVRAESKQAEEAKAVPTHDDTDLIEQMLEALRSCSGVPHWPALIPTINAARKRLETPQQAEAVPLTHVLVPVDEPTDEMVDAACAAVDGLCRVDFVRAYVAAFAHLKAGYRDESYWCGWNAAIKFQQAESAHQYNLANRLRVHLANRHTLTGPEFKDGVAGILAEYYTAPQQAEAVPTFDEQLREVAKRAIPQQAEAVPFNHATQLQIAYVKGLGDGAMQAEAVPPDVEVIRKALERAFIMGQNYWADADSESYSANKRSDVTRQKFNAMRDEVCAAIAQQKGANHG